MSIIVTEKVKYKKHRKKRKIKLSRKMQLIVVALCLVVFASTATLYVRYNIKKYCKEYAEAIIATNVSDSLYLAASQVINDNVKYKNYEEFVNITRDSSSEICFIQTNMLLVNLLMVDLTNNAQKNINTLCSNYKVAMPIGVMFGSVMYAEHGNVHDIDIVPIGNIYCSYQTSFENAGINQTRHSLYFNVEATLEIVLPLYIKKQIVSIRFLVFENIIVGKVPEFYLGGGSNIDLTP